MRPIRKKSVGVVKTILCASALALSTIGASAADTKGVQRLNDEVLQLIFSHDYKAAEIAARKAVSAARSADVKSDDYQFAHLNLAAALIAQGKAVEAKAILSALITVAFEADAADNIKVQALAMILQIRTSDAIDPGRLDYLNKIIDTGAKLWGANSPNLTGALVERSIVEYTIGNGEACVKDVQRVISIRELSADPPQPDDLALQNNLSLCLLRAGRHDEAINGFHHLVAETGRLYGPDDERTYKSQSDLGFALEKSGQVSKAAEVAADVLQKRLKRAGPDDTGTLISMINLASANQQINRLGEAERIYLDVIAVYDRGRQIDVWKQSALQGLASLYTTVGHYDEAKKYLEIGDRELDQLNANDIDISLRTGARQHWANLYQAIGETDMAVATLKKIVEAKRDSSTSPKEIATVYGNLATLAFFRNDMTEARRYAQLALDVDEANDINDFETKIRYAKILLHDGDQEKARTLLETCLAEARSRLGSDHAQTASIANTLAVISLLRDERAGALRLLAANVRNLSLYESGDADAGMTGAGGSAVIEAGNIAIAGAMRQLDPEFAELAAEFVLNYKARIGNVDAGLRRVVSSISFDQSYSDAFRTYIKSRDDFILVSKRVVAGDMTLLVRLRQLQNELSSAKAALETLAPLSAASMDDPYVSPTDIAGRMSDRTALIEYFIYSPNAASDTWQAERAQRFGAMVLRADRKEPIFIDLASTEDVQELVSPLSATFSDTSGNRKLTTALYDLLIAKLLPSLSSVDHLFISTAGVLGAVPFDMLMDQQGRRFIDSSINYRFVVSGRFVGQNKASANSGGRELVVFGGADFDAIGDKRMSPAIVAANISEGSTFIPTRSARTLSGFVPLPSTQVEVGVVAETWKEKFGASAKAYIGEQASEANLRQIGSPRVLHLATHGITMTLKRTDTLLPSLQVAIAFSGANHALENDGEADGIVFGYEVEQLDLRKTELVVLSACETGIGVFSNYEGAIAVEQAFRRAGARAVLSTLHPISDAYTTLFMRDFYVTWLGMEKPDADQALREVKLSWLHSDNEAQRDPRLWAPFVIVSQTGAALAP
ncbi:CHAT domain-containing protein [Pannonibacter sp. Q-1]